MSRRPDPRDDSGVAVVAAVGVALIGAVLAMLVVGQTIIVTQDTGRDRVRTTEIHSAEGVLDSAVYDLTRQLSCDWPDTTVGSGASATNVATTVEYFDEDRNPLTDCSAGIVEGDPAYAVVTAQATAVEPVTGIDPVRTIESTVTITPRQGLSTGTTLFSSSSMQGTNNGQIIPTDPDEPAGLWVDSGNFECNSNFTVDGDVVVPAGGIYTTNSCKITGDAWARDYFSDSAGNKVDTRVGGDVTVRNGNMTVSNASKYDGSISVSGSISGNGFDKSVIAGTICANSIEKVPAGKTYAACTGFTDFAQRGFPEITLVAQDWIDEGFTVKNKTTFTNDVIAGWDLSTKASWVETNYRADPCTFGSWVSPSPISLSATPSVYDLASNPNNCSFQTNSGVTFKLYADTAIFADSINLSNTTTFLSGDGEAHNLWLMVPYGESGNLQTSNQLRIESPLAAFYYSPNQLTISNNQAVRGQIYGRNLSVSNHFQMEHVSVGVPGVDLGSTDLDVTSSGFIVEVLSKRERQQE